MPAVGLMLSFAALGNLLQSYADIYKNILGIISAALFILMTLKFLCNFPGLKNDLSAPIGASVFPTYSMCIMLLASYVKPYYGGAAYGIWIAGILLHIVLILYFTNKFIRGFKIMQVFPSWFIVYVGIAVAAVTGKLFHPMIGQLAFGFGLISYFILLVIVGRRIFIVKEIPEPAMPTLIICSAPGSLCLAGYINSFDEKNMMLFWFLLIISQGIYIFAIIKLFALLKLKFYPSYSGFTFPLVISAMALKLSNGFLINQGIPVTAFSILVKIEEIIAIAIVFYVFIRYLMFLIKAKPSKS